MTLNQFMKQLLRQGASFDQLEFIATRYANNQNLMRSELLKELVLARDRRMPDIAEAVPNKEASLGQSLESVNRVPSRAEDKEIIKKFAASLVDVERDSS